MMNAYALLAFVIMPIVVVAIAYAAMRIHEREAARLRETHPAE